MAPTTTRVGGEWNSGNTSAPAAERRPRESRVERNETPANCRKRTSAQERASHKVSAGSRRFSAHSQRARARNPTSTGPAALCFICGPPHGWWKKPISAGRDADGKVDGAPMRAPTRRVLRSAEPPPSADFGGNFRISSGSRSTLYSAVRGDRKREKKNSP